MPTKNRIHVLLAENNTTAKALVPFLPDVDRTSMSYIVQGRVLPTKATLNAMTAALNCEKKDLYDLKDIDLGDLLNACGTLTMITPELGSAKTFPAKPIGDHGHDGMERVYIWYPKGGKEALFEVIKQLDYPSVAEWFRDMARITFLKAAGLDGKTLHDVAMCVNQVGPAVAALIQAIKDAPVTFMPKKEQEANHETPND